MIDWVWIHTRYLFLAYGWSLSKFCCVHENAVTMLAQKELEWIHELEFPFSIKIIIFSDMEKTIVLSYISRKYENKFRWFSDDWWRWWLWRLTALMSLTLTTLMSLTLMSLTLTTLMTLTTDDSDDSDLFLYFFRFGVRSRYIMLKFMEKLSATKTLRHSY